MTKKHFFLLGILFILSTILGISLGKLDFFGFFDGRHELHLTYLLFTIITTYFITITIFFLEFIHERKRAITYTCATMCFGIPFVFLQQSLFSSFLTIPIFFILLWYLGIQVHKRSKLFIKFSPSDIFFPIAKQGFLLLIVVFAVINFFHSRDKALNNSLLSPNMIQIISKPAVVLLNQQISSQLKIEINKLPSTLSSNQKKQIIELVLSQTINALDSNKTLSKIGLRSSDISIQNIEIYEDGGINIQPAFENALPKITYFLNEKIKQYIFFVPFIVALLTFLIFQPLILPLQWIESGIILILYYAAKKLNFIKITTIQSLQEKIEV